MSAAPRSGPRPLDVARAEIWPSVEISETVDESIDVLRNDPELFVRGSLVRVIEGDGGEGGPIKRDAAAPVIRRVVAPYLTERLSLGARFMKRATKGRGAKKQEVDVQMQPPSWIATHVLARETWPGLRNLTAVVSSPTIRADGEIVQTPGYDRSSGILYRPRERYRRVADCPSRDDAMAARDRLLEVIDDFPMNETARAAWLAMLFTFCGRELAEGATPLFAADASTPGSGKGLSIRAPYLIAHGVEIAHMSIPPNDEEFRKQITTLLLSGDPGVLLDNVGVPLGGDSIEALITAPVWKVRLLGKNEDSGALVPRIVTCASGNGLEFVGDMGRRTLRIRIDTRHENPEERTDFRHPERAGSDKLLAWVRANRAELVVDALTCLRAWHVAGREGAVKNWGSFESWTDTIARCVTWLDMPDPTLARATQDATLDPVRQALATIFDAIERFSTDVRGPDGKTTGAKRGVTAGELVRAAFPPPSQQGPEQETDLAEAIASLTPQARDAATRARLLGRKLKVGRIINGQRLEAVPGAARAVRYSLTPADAGAGK